jgi:hypothetical protein
VASVVQERLEKESEARHKEIKQLNTQRASLFEHLSYERKQVEEAKKAIADVTKQHQVRPPAVWSSASLASAATSARALSLPCCPLAPAFPPC